MNTALLRWGWIAVIAAVVLASLALRPPLPVDETRYLAVAWEMWRDQQWWVPTLNGLPYSHKPPLLFWLLHAGWALFGVNDGWPRLLGGASAIACGLLTRQVARRLFAQEPAVAELAPWLLVGALFWLGFSTMLMFDQLASAFVLLGWLGVLRARDGAHGGMVLVALALGLGALAKGPVAFLFVLPALLFAPPPARRRRTVLVHGALATLLGLGMVLAWAVAAMARAGPGYGQALVWHLGLGRVVDTFAHAQPWWWYLPLLGLLWLPWSLAPAFWRGLRDAGRAGLAGERGARFCIGVGGTTFLALSAIDGKQPHYLLPLFPLLAMLMARRLCAAPPARLLLSTWPLALIGLGLALLPWAPARPDWAAALPPWPGLALAAAVIVAGTRRVGTPAQAIVTAGLGAAILLGALIVVAPHALARHDLVALSRDIGAAQRSGEVAFVGSYRGQFTFAGRLQRPLPILAPGEVRAWLQAHPQGLAVGEIEQPDSAEGRAAAWTHPYRGRYFAGWTAASLAAAPQALPAARDDD